ncbi:MAG: glutamate--cysteine ligase [Pseudohongiellaceae bacterium]|nr:glutamate--cysteine ligase [Pseudohongiellaceae bacterium]
MTNTLQESLNHFALPQFKSEWGQINRGIEKESLRVTSDGRLAQSPHPEGLGSALTHPYITTDFSEALLELITPVCSSIESSLEFLTDLHSYTYANMAEGEKLWVSSMPCYVESDDKIPLAHYGSSNIGRLKTLYREGLGHRYGRLMQTISGIHYNFSMPTEFWSEYRQIKQSSLPLQQFQTNQYLHLIRNFHRYCWLLPYLFGASPAVCKCFTQGRAHDLDSFDEATLFKPYATALRMGNLGYKSDAQKSLFVCYNDLDNYLDSLQGAMTTPYAPYQAIGAKKGDHHLQINTNLLQLENEFYGTIRPKRVGESGQRPLTLLRQGGVQYIEVRILDLNPFLPLGLDAQQIRFLDAFLLFCLLSESPACNPSSYYEIEENLAKVVNGGRDPELQLSKDGVATPFKEWAQQILNQVGFAATLLDSLDGGEAYTQANAAQQAKLQDSELTPSAQILARMRAEQLSFGALTMAQSSEHEAFFKGKSISAERLAMLRAASKSSFEQQAKIEAEDTQSFDEYLANWNATAEEQNS